MRIVSLLPDLIPESSSWWKCVCVLKSVSSGELHKVLVREWIRSTPSPAELSQLRFIGMVTKKQILINKLSFYEVKEEKTSACGGKHSPLQLICLKTVSTQSLNTVSLSLLHKSPGGDKKRSCPGFLVQTLTQSWRKVVKTAV